MVLTVFLTTVLCKELSTEVKREKKDISKLQKLGFNGNKFNNGYYPSGGYLPPSYNYYYRSPAYPVPQCDCRVPPPPPPIRCGTSFYPGPSGFGQTLSSLPRGNYGPPRPGPFPPTAAVDDTLVVYPANTLANPPTFTVNAVAPVVTAHSPNAFESSGYTYDKPNVPFH